MAESTRRRQPRAYDYAVAWSQWGLPSYPAGISEPTHVRLCAFGGNAHPHAWISESMLRPRGAAAGDGMPSTAREKLSTWEKFAKKTGIDIKAPVRAMRKRKPGA